MIPILHEESGTRLLLIVAFPVRLLLLCLLLLLFLPSFILPISWGPSTQCFRPLVPKPIIHGMVLVTRNLQHWVLGPSEIANINDHNNTSDSNSNSITNTNTNSNINTYNTYNNKNSEAPAGLGSSRVRGSDWSWRAGWFRMCSLLLARASAEGPM